MCPKALVSWPAFHQRELAAAYLEIPSVVGPVADKFRVMLASPLQCSISSKSLSREETLEKEEIQD